MQDLQVYLDSTHFINSNTTKYNAHQIGANIITTLAQANDAQIIIVGACLDANNLASLEKIRNEFYQMYYWHAPLKIADIGNVLQGNSIQDTKAALSIVLELLHATKKIVLVIGDRHDLTLCQYDAFRKNEEIIDASIVDMLIDLKEQDEISEDSFLYNLLTDSPNFIRHYNHLAFQSYYTNPKMLQTLDALHFDCHRLGKVREDLNEMEPIMRSSDMVSFDLNAVRHSDAPCNTTTSPNGLHGDEACQLTRYAGMSDRCCSMGIYGYNSALDVNDMACKLQCQMMWYFIDGIYYKQHEADFNNTTLFDEFHVNMSGHAILFVQSKRTLRWWMQLHDKRFIPCTRKDYLIAANNEIPERWMREMEKNV